METLRHARAHTRIYIRNANAIYVHGKASTHAAASNETESYKGTDDNQKKTKTKKKTEENDRPDNSVKEQGTAIGVAPERRPFPRGAGGFFCFDYSLLSFSVVSVSAERRCFEGARGRQPCPYEIGCSSTYVVSGTGLSAVS